MLPFLHQSCPKGSVVCSENDVVSASGQKDAAYSPNHPWFRISALRASLPPTAGSMCHLAYALPTHLETFRQAAGSHTAAQGAGLGPPACAGVTQERGLAALSLQAYETGWLRERLLVCSMEIVHAVGGCRVWGNRSCVRQRGGRSSSCALFLSLIQLLWLPLQPMKLHFDLHEGGECLQHFVDYAFNVFNFCARGLAEQFSTEWGGRNNFGNKWVVLQTCFNSQSQLQLGSGWGNRKDTCWRQDRWDKCRVITCCVHWWEYCPHVHPPQAPSTTSHASHAWKCRGTPCLWLCSPTKGKARDRGCCSRSWQEGAEAILPFAACYAHLTHPSVAGFPLCCSWQLPQHHGDTFCHRPLYPPHLSLLVVWKGCFFSSIPPWSTNAVQGLYISAGLPSSVAFQLFWISGQCFNSSLLGGWLFLPFSALVKDKRWPLLSQWCSSWARNFLS